MEIWPLSHSVLNDYYNLQAQSMEALDFPQTTTTDLNAMYTLNIMQVKATLSLSSRYHNTLADLSICQTLSLLNFPAI